MADPIWGKYLKEKKEQPKVNSDESSVLTEDYPERSIPAEEEDETINFIEQGLAKAINFNEQGLAKAINFNGQGLAKIINFNEQGLAKAVHIARKLVNKKMHEHGIPGLAVALTLDGVMAWQEGFGLADVENNVPVTAETVMRIGPISKCITMTALAKLVESGQLNLDQPVSELVPDWPETEPPITPRLLASNLPGIRNFFGKKELGKLEEFGGALKIINGKEFKSLALLLDAFRKGEGLNEPGNSNKCGFALLTEVVEAVTKQSFHGCLRQYFKDLGLNHTHLDESEKLILNRGRTYYRSPGDNILLNTPLANPTANWIEEGVLSNVEDLAKFGNELLYSFQYHEIGDREDKEAPCSAGKPSFFGPDSVQMLWGTATPAQSTPGFLANPGSQGQQFSSSQLLNVGQSEHAEGGSGHLEVEPGKWEPVSGVRTPRGVVVAVLANIGGIDLEDLAKELIRVFRSL